MEVLAGCPPPERHGHKLSTSPSSDRNHKQSTNRLRGANRQMVRCYLQLLAGRTGPPLASAAGRCSPAQHQMSSDRPADGTKESQQNGNFVQVHGNLVGIDGHWDDGRWVKDAPPFWQRLPGAGVSHLRGWTCLTSRWLQHHLQQSNG